MTITEKSLIKAPVIILVRPQMGENIGSAARAMMNCGLSDLRLVNPRNKWPNPAALTLAAGGSDIINRAQVFETVVAASHDVNLMIATTARKRDLAIKSVNPRDAAEIMINHCHKFGQDRENSGNVGIMFGPESSGLDNDEVAIADFLVKADLNPAYASLNLAQAVLILAWEWHMAKSRSTVLNSDVEMDLEQAATIAEREVFFCHLEAAIDESRYFSANEMKRTVKRNLRAFFNRRALNSKELRTLHGLIKALKTIK